MLFHSFDRHFLLSRFRSLLGLRPNICRLLDTSHYTPPNKLPEAISINEFKGNASTGKYQCILVDPQEHRILDILPDRTQSHLADYWIHILRLERRKVKFFVCDMWLPYAEMARTFFPNEKDHRRQVSFHPAGHMGD